MQRTAFALKSIVSALCNCGMQKSSSKKALSINHFQKNGFKRAVLRKRFQKAGSEKQFQKSDSGKAISKKRFRKSGSAVKTAQNNKQPTVRTMLLGCFIYVYLRFFIKKSSFFFCSPLSSGAIDEAIDASFCSFKLPSFLPF